MRVSPFETCRFKVKSSSLEDRYLVDLLSYGGRGKCECKWGMCQHEPFAKAGDPRCHEIRCRHLKDSRLKLFEWLRGHLAGKGLLTYAGNGFTIDLETSTCSCGEKDCAHQSAAREDLVSRYVKSVLREHTNAYDS